MKTSSIRNFRIDDDIWKAAMKAAKKAGVSVTFIVKTSLRAFSKEPCFTIGEPEEVHVPDSIHKIADSLDAVVRKSKQ